MSASTSRFYRLLFSNPTAAGICPLRHGRVPHCLARAPAAPPPAATEGYKYKIQINPNASLPLLLNFRPAEQRERDVELAFSLVAAGMGHTQPIRKARA